MHVAAVPILTSRTPHSFTVSVSNLRRNFVALLGPRLKLGARKFGELTPLKLLSVSKRCCLVS